MTALLHREFRMMLMDIAAYGETSLERELAGLALDLYDAEPENPKIVNLVNNFARGALGVA
jgi:hypothetical protein